MSKSHKYTETVSRVNPDKSIRLDTKTYNITVEPRIKPKLGVMLVGWGGNNGSTLTTSLLAYQKGLTWSNKNGKHKVKFLGSISQFGSVHIGYDDKQLPHSKLFREIGDLYDPSDIVIGGWDICSDNIYEACRKAHVIDHDLLEQLKPELVNMVPLRSFVLGDFIAGNQSDRTNNVFPCTGNNPRALYLEKINSDIEVFKKNNALDTVIVMWTASTERFSSKSWSTIHDIFSGFDSNDSEISPSIIFAVAASINKCIFVNCSPQNTLCPGIVEMAKLYKTYAIGSDLKTSQTRLKSVLVDYLAASGVKPLSIVSYNHLGNNDGKNLDDAPQFKSKEMTKRNVIDDVVLDNPQLFNGIKPDHCVVIKYIPAVGDSKRAMDEYYSELMLDGRHTMAIHSTCEDSLLAVPVMLDLALFSEFLSRVHITCDDNTECRLDPTMSLLSYFFKSPVVGIEEPLINSFYKKRYALENFFRILADLPPLTHVNLGFRTLKK